MTIIIDIRAAKARGDVSILIEVKGFENTPSLVEYLASVVGQYILYQTVLEYTKTAVPLYLAVPKEAYSGVLNELIGQQVIARANVHLMIFDPVQEEVLLWIP